MTNGKSDTKKSQYQIKQEILGAALKKYHKVCAPALAKKERLEDIAYDEYERVCASAWKEYQRELTDIWGKE